MKKATGFTIIEVMIVIAIAIILAALVFGDSKRQPEQTKPVVTNSR
jgi:prepilin-type N-terminal cleavage/methylation domain-containing protein